MIKSAQKGDFRGVVKALVDPDLHKTMMEKDPKRQVYRIKHDIEDLALSRHRTVKSLLELLAELDKR